MLVATILGETQGLKDVVETIEMYINVKAGEWSDVGVHLIRYCLSVPSPLSVSPDAVLDL